MAWKPNWKLKLTNNKTAIFGNQGGTFLDDLDKIAGALGVSKDKCAENIINIRVRKAHCKGGSAIDSIQITYLIETKDGKSLNVEGYKHGGDGGGGNLWDYEGDYLLKIYGEYWDYQGQLYINYLECKSFYINGYDTWNGVRGTKTDKNKFTLTAPVCFFSRTYGNMLAGLGAYEGQLYNVDIERLQGELTAEKEKGDKYKKKYGDLWDQWTSIDKLQEYFGGEKEIWPEGLKLVKPELDRLNKEKTQAETDRDTAKADLKTWTDTFGTLKPAEVKTEYDKPKEQHTAEDLEKHKPEDLKPADYDQIKGDLKTANEKITTLEADKTNLNNQLTAKDTSIAELNTKLTNKDNELTTANNSINTLTSEKNQLTKDKNELDTKLKEKDGEITKLNQQLSQQGSQAGETAQYLNKLLAIYRTEITDETTTFYQSLKIDNNEVNEKYGNRAISYLKKLEEKELNGESEPEQVINAFKIVALILAVEKAQKESDEYIGKAVAKTPTFKKSKYNAFNKIKDAWDEMAEVAEPTEKNNPLYLPVITQKSSYITQLNNIIKLWQP